MIRFESSAAAEQEMLIALDRVRLRYTAPYQIYHSVCCWGRRICGVFGDGPNASYEWFIWDGDKKKLETSDCGYGCTAVALRDVLNKQDL